jgi:hypothetical protein
MYIAKLQRIAGGAWLILPCGFASLLLSGCADTDQFQAPIASFAAAADSSATSFSALDAASAANLTALRQAEALQVKRVAYAGSDCALTSKGCSLYFRQGTGSDPKPVYVASVVPKSVAFINGIRDYANALNQLEKADATADVQSAFSSAMGTVSAVAGALNLPAGEASAMLNKPLSATIGWSFGEYQNQIKDEALKSATKAADPIIQQAMPILDAELRFAREAQTSELEQDVQTKDDAFSHQPTAANLKADVQAANTLDAALSSKPSDLFDSLAVAHSKLAAAIQNPKSNPSGSITAIASFVQQAQNVEQMIKVISPTPKN